MSELAKTWSFSAPIERFEMDGTMHFLCIPKSIEDEVRACPEKRYVITVNDVATWHCGLLGTGDGRWFVMVSRAKLKEAETTHGGWVHVDLAVDQSKYGMAVPPDLQAMLDDDEVFLARFDAMLPGKRRNAIHQIASAKTEATVTKRIVKLMADLGLATVLWGWALFACGQASQPIALGHDRTDAYVDVLRGKTVAVVGNHTAVFDTPQGTVHLVDSLLRLGIDVAHVFAPEHGFRGEAANGAHIQDGIDGPTGLPVYSLHGAHKKPQPDQLDVDALVFDIQDVGARFYTYVSSMVLCMEACAEQGVDMVVLDRPNPHGHHIQGPMLDPAFKSFVGWIPTPMVHGMTLGELALMAKEEGWFDSSEKLSLQVIPCLHWDHDTPYALDVRPSPNLPNQTSIDLYPSLCLFEPTAISVGRGTDTPFQILGHPDAWMGSYAFTPVSVAGAAPHPKHENVACIGQSMNGLAQAWRSESMARGNAALPGFDLQPLWAWAEQWRNLHDGSLDGFITSPSFFDKLAGTDQVRLALEANTPLAELEAQWDEEHAAFLALAQRYLLYPWSLVDGARR